MSFRYSLDLNGFSKFMDNGGWILMPLLFVGIIALVFKIISRWIYFKKCGEEGWKALIPIYTDITLVKTSSLNWWWVLFLYVTTISSIFSSYVNFNGATTYLKILSTFTSLFSLVTVFAKFNIGYNICKKFKVSVGYAVLIALLEPIGLLVLGVSKSNEYDKDVPVSPNGVFKSQNDNVSNTTTNSEKTSSDIEFCERCGNKIEKDTIYCGNCGNKVR